MTGVKVFGVTIHLVDEGVDSGAIHPAARARDPNAASDAGAVRDLLRPLERDAMCEAIALFAAAAIRRDPGHPRRILVAG